MRPILLLSRPWLGLSLLVACGAAPLLGAGISVGELNYSDPEGSDFDFIELVNTGGPSVPLQGLTFTGALDTPSFETNLSRPANGLWWFGTARSSRRGTAPGSGSPMERFPEGFPRMVNG